MSHLLRPCLDATCFSRFQFLSCSWFIPFGSTLLSTFKIGFLTSSFCYGASAITIQLNFVHSHELLMWAFFFFFNNLVFGSDLLDRLIQMINPTVLDSCTTKRAINPTEFSFYTFSPWTFAINIILTINTFDSTKISNLSLKCIINTILIP